MEIEILPDQRRMLVILRRPGRPDWRERFNPDSAKKRKQLAAECGVTDDEFTAQCEECRARGGAVIRVINPSAPALDCFIVRKIDATRGTGEQVRGSPADILTRLQSIPVDHVIEWQSGDSLCCLDVDYHDSTPPSADWLTAQIMTNLRPRPIAWHVSRNGGLHCFYIASDPLTAEELAATAALRYRSIDSTAGLELKRVVRGPGAARVHTYTTQDSGVGFTDWLGSPEYDGSERASWLEAQAMEIDRRYAHERCPISGGPSHAEPVVVGEAGIYCHRCAGLGLSLGCRRAGFAPWAAILGAPSSGELGRLVRSLTHWGHAKWILTQTYGLPEVFARLAYSAAIKAYHAARPSAALIGRVFDPNTEDYARVNDSWVSIATLHPYPRDILPVLSTFPAALYVTGDEVKISPAAVCDLSQFKNLQSRGYSNIELVHGIRLAESDRLTAAVPNPDIIRTDARRIARYIPKAKRLSDTDAWAEVERIVPRVDQTLIKLLICAFSVAQETRAGLLPILFISGPAGTSKSATCKIAAGIYGSRCGEATFEHDQSRYRASIREAAATSPVVVLNEMLKEGARHRLSVRQTLDIVLTLTPDSTSHGLYRGPVRMGRLPAVVITEPSLPLTIRDETQLSRRIRHYRVTGRKDDWPATIQAAGVPGQDLTLLRCTGEHTALACDSIVSQIADDYLLSPQTWDAIAESLGCRTVEKDANFEDMSGWNRELFRLLCAEPKLTGKDAKQYSNGYKKLTKEDHDKPINTVYSMFADGYGADWTSSRRLLEKSWDALLGVPGKEIHLDMKPNGTNVYMRFRIGPDKSPLAINEQIVDPTNWDHLL